MPSSRCWVRCRLIVDNFESLSRFVAGIDRLHALSNAVLPAPPSRRHSCPRSSRREGEPLAWKPLTLRTPQFDRVLIKDLNLALQPGKRC